MRKIPWSTAVVATVLACDSPTVQPPAADELAPAHGVGAIAADFTPEVHQWLSDLRRLYAPLHSLERAQAAGFSAELSPCVEHPTDGGMGVHWGNPGRIDGTVAALEPEVLLFAPRPNGTYGLAAVEFIVPYAAWTSSTPPTLFGMEFHPNPGLELWMMHIWLWRNNPSGLFSDWNPAVSCP